MKICFLLRIWPIYGGGETVTQILANEFVSRGLDVHIVYFIDNGWDKVCKLDKRIHNFRIHNVNIGRFHYDPMNSKYVIEKLSEYVNQQNIDIIINQWWPVEFFKGLSINHDYRLISVHHMNVFQKIQLPNNDLKSLIKKSFRSYFQNRYMNSRANSLVPFIQNSDKFVFLAESFISEFLKYTTLPIDADKLAFINNPISLESDVLNFDLSRKEHIVLFVGRIDDNHKRLNYILQAWSLCEKKLGDWKLVIVGTGKDLKKNILLANKLHLNNVYFEGQQNPKPYYEKASLFVMTSHHEGWGMTLVEAQSYGVVPVVMNSFSSVSEIIKDDYNGLLIKDNDIRAFAEGIIKLAGLTEWREQLAINGMKSVRRFDVKLIANKWEELFESMFNVVRKK